MGLFDFPRIHFKGNADFNVATINNSAYFPLTVYDTVNARAFLPPRLYFSSQEKITAVASSLNPTIYFDEQNQYYYIEILPINTIEILREWCRTPLCHSTTAPDFAYQPYYAAAEQDLAQLTGMKLLLQAPGYWNMYGDMGVNLTDVTTCGVQLFDGNTVSSYTPEQTGLPQDISQWFDLNFNFNSRPTKQRKASTTTGTLCGTINSQAVHAYLFADCVNLFRQSETDPREVEVMLRGAPYRFMPMIYGTWRVYNWLPPMASSTRYTAAIPLQNIENDDNSPLLAFFQQQSGYDARPIMGVYVTLTMMEVYENRYNQNVYLQNEPGFLNPAQTTVVGSIMPWYVDDMRSGVLGRHLISLPCQPAVASPIPIKMTPAITRLEILPDNTALFSVDMGNTWPEQIIPNFDRNHPPVKRGEATFETFDLGVLSFRYNANKWSEFASISVYAATNSLEAVRAKGTLFDFHLKDATLIASIKENYIQVFLEKADNTEVHVMAESMLYVTSESKGIYAEEGDAPSEGYQSFDANREPFKLRVFRKGVPVLTQVPLLMTVFPVPEAGNDPSPRAPISQEWIWVTDNQILELGHNPLIMKDNAIYYFTYDGQYPNNQVPHFSTSSGYTVMDTGSFAIMRVLPHKDYSQYLDPANWDSTPPSYEVVYEEVFKLYDVVYPAMAEVHPFNQETWDTIIMADMVVNRVDPKYWNSVLYMPKTRELSRAQRALLSAWRDYLYQLKGCET